jgi:chromate transporter
MTETAAERSESSVVTYTLWQLVMYFLKLGTMGFGGPVALVGYMNRDLVEERKWITEADYKEGMTLAQMAPGPMAAQLAIYLGYVHYRVLGATVAGIAFVLPSFLMVVALGWGYIKFGELSWMQAVFYGVGSSVIGIIAISAHKLTTKTIGKNKLLWAIYLVMVASTVITKSEILWLVLLAGVIVWFRRAPPVWFRNWQAIALGSLISVSLLWSNFLKTDQANGPRDIFDYSFLAPIFTSIDSSLLGQIGIFFTKAGAFVFGSGLAIVPYLYGGVVVEHQWLTEKQFVDAVAVAMITPGPVVITVGFIGYLISGFAGACVAALATFLPCYLFTILPAPYFKKYGKRAGILAFVDGVTAAAVGAITGSVIVIAQRSIFDIPTALIALGTTALLWKFKKLTEPMVIAGAALIGLVLFPMLRP